MKTKIISILTLIALSTSFVGCKKFLDVNNNPNIANNPNVELVLPSAQVAIASVMGAPFQINGSFWAQHWTQSPLASQYKNFDQYLLANSWLLLNFCKIHLLLIRDEFLSKLLPFFQLGNLP